MKTFQLTEELIDQIIYAMENQDEIFLLDSHTETLVTSDEIETAENEEQDQNDEIDSEKDVELNGEEMLEGAVGRYIEIPEWTPVEGFNVMENFVHTLKNPTAKNELRSALSSGKGVFRKFKAIVKERAEIEQLWYWFKHNEMKKVVIDWYNRNMEACGMKSLGSIPAETEDLVLTDFTISKEDGSTLELIKEYDKEAFYEFYKGRLDYIVDTLFQEERGEKEPSVEKDIILKVESSGSEFAGFLWAEKLMGKKKQRAARIIQLYVLDEFRGLGIASALIERLVSIASDMDIKHVIVELPVEPEAVKERYFSYSWQGISKKSIIPVE